jgi:DNA-directed RNA polymerase subunit E'/Rpb7
MRRKFAILASVAVVALLNALPARAHHSAVIYDFTRSEWIQGTVKSISVLNPHMSMTLVVSDDQGTHEVQFEGHGVNNFYRVGWRANMIKVGDHVRARV